MTVEDPKESIAVCQIDLVNGCVLHILAPALHFGLAVDDSVAAALLDILVGVGFRQIDSHLKLKFDKPQQNYTD
jgi:hypothetical protein